ncbi:unnamed protein product [Medioppia subpectinata]|uniref:Dilute class unconventional myosin n=1 Tax=Medioppia subpectinata TaxID=1979941 RepID=A0A7R9KJZ7_9ACAR|nr:unnamed protein product [Medioppia subpectinata]CAG2105109.1 unnamed protein product [Medioppia subpectinata]
MLFLLGGFEFNNIRAVQQLRACGVLETIRISSNGFPSRWSYPDFANRYRVLRIGTHRKFAKSGSQSQQSGPVPKAAPRKLLRAGSSTSSEIRTLCEDIVKIVYEEKVFSKLSGESEQQTQAQQLFQFGKTKIFFRSGQVALLERIRSQKLKECAVLLQRMIRGWLVKRRYLKIRFTIMRLQCYGRAFLARKLYLHLKLTKAATRIQTKWRAWSTRKKFLKIKRTAIGLQQYGRGLIARRKFLTIKQHLAAVTIQRFWRGYTARKAYQQRIRRVIIVQSLIRRFLAKRELKKLRIEARSVEHVTNLNKGLERKIIELQQKVDDLNSERKALIQTDGEISEYKSQFSRFETEIKNLKNEMKQKDIQFQALEDEMNESKNVNEKLTKDVERHKSKVNDLLTNNAKIRQEADPKLIENAVREKEKLLITKYEKEKKALIDERENERASRQQLLRKYMALEDKYQSGGRGEDDDRSPDISTVSLMMRCSELEQECAKCKQENQEMRELIAASADLDDNERGASLLAQQCAQMQIECDRYREERSNLKTIVLSQESNIKDVSGESELISAFKAIIKQLESELDETKEKNEQMKNEMNSLVTDNNRQQQVIGINSEPIAVNGSEDMITRFKQENTVLKEKCEKLVLENKQIRMDLMRRKILENDEDEEESPNQNDYQNMNYVGMFEYKQQNESLILRILINGEEAFGEFDESLKSFDLSEYRQMFSDIAIWIHQGVIKQCEERIQSLIVPAILEYEGLASSGMYSQSIQRSGSVTDDTNLSPSPTEKPIDSLIKELSYLNRILLLHVIEGDIIHQIFKQLFYFMCSSSLNNLLLRKDLCHWNKAMQIRFNLSSLEQWCREQQIPKWNECVEKLEPIIQATKLLQTRKSEEHIPTIVEMCNKLSSSQIIKILNLYTAGDEERISIKKGLATVLKKI